MAMLRKQLIAAIGLALIFIASVCLAKDNEKTNTKPAVRDGQHDFDFYVGKWKVHSHRLLKPLSGSNDWVDFDGISLSRPVWDGRANMDELEADAPNGHIEGLTIRTYNKKTGEWSLYWANANNGEISLPATVGHFENGRGVFYDKEMFNGKPIVVRYIWSNITADHCRWEQAFSPDDGKTWETNWITENTRVRE
jgi:hypothetical protein